MEQVHDHGHHDSPVAVRTGTDPWAATTVRLLHIENDPVKVSLWDGIAREYETVNPGVRIELSTLDNQRFKLWLPHLLESDQRPHIIPNWRSLSRQAA